MKSNLLKNCIPIFVFLSTHAMAAAPTTDCSKLATLSIANTVIDSATIESGTSATTYAAAGPMPENCVVKGVIESRQGVTDPDTGSSQYGTHFELRLPTSWSGRFFYQGSGGSGGYVAPADGIVASQGTSQQIPALWRGYTVC